MAYDTPQKIVLDSDDNIYVIGTTADNSDVLSESTSKRLISEVVSGVVFFYWVGARKRYTAYNIAPKIVTVAN